MVKFSDTLSMKGDTVTIQEQMSVRCKMQLGVASEAEVVALVADTFDATVKPAWRPCPGCGENGTRCCSEGPAERE